MLKKFSMVSALLAATPLAWSQSSVQLYGIVDAAIRHTTNQGATGNSGLTQMIGGGMSQSRWGLNVAEDLGGGLRAIANVENRFGTDNGAVLGSQFFQQSWVGLESKSFGRITLGRQLNVLFDAVVTSYPTFPYSPFFDALKPEIGLALTARADNMIKYVAEYGPFKGALQFSFGEDSPTGGRTVGAYLRYASNGLTAAGAFQNRELGSGRKIDAWTVGGAYRIEKWYFNLGYGSNKIDGGPLTSPVDLATLSALWSGSSQATGNFGGPAFLAANQRELVTIGLGYQIMPLLNVGAHYYRTKQSGWTADGDARVNFFVFATDYALSKRTDIYAELDATRAKGNANLNGTTASDGPKSRNGYTVGIRHRF